LSELNLYFIENGALILEIDKINSYPEFLNSIKAKIRASQVKAALSVNAEMIFLYWEIGRMILERQKEEGWGAKIIDNLSRDIRIEYPDVKGFSSRNLKYMRKFAESYPDFSIVQQLVAQISWGHNIVLLDKIESSKERLWYARQVIENGWSRNVMVHQIEGGLFQRQALPEKTTNYERTLPAPQSELAEQTLKDPYIFDFLSLGKEARERDIENELMRHITNFLLELGAGFAFIGRQYHLEVAGKDFYIDLLFYHLKLRCYVAIELKIGEFKPEYAGKINFYLSALDDLAKSSDDNPSIGIVLCKTKNKVVVEYALRDMSKPIGVSEYRLSHAIPEELRKSLPEPEVLEAELKEKDI
jgi:predicted nuclease of restriction endonuclease-like (RecB) superfamily